MVKAKPRKPPAPRCAKAMELVNKNMDVLPSAAKMRKKAKPKKTKKNVTKREKTKTWRSELPGDRKQILYAMETAAARFRQVVTGKPRLRRTGVYKKAAPKVLPLRPPNWDEMLALLKAPRAKPTTPGQEVLYLLPGATPVLSWLGPAKIQHLAPHKKDYNWIVVLKPWVLKPLENPFVCVHSTNVFIAPPGIYGGGVSLLKDKGLYTLYCKSRDEYYVGTSVDIPQRVRQHEAGNGSAVTRKWKGDVERLRPLTNGKGKYADAEVREVWALVKKFFPNGKRDGIYAEHEGPKVRGAGYSLSQ